MKKTLFAVAASVVLAGCISTDLGPPSARAPDTVGVNAERSTGSNLSRRDRNVQEGGREELERLQRPGGSNQIGKSGRT